MSVFTENDFKRYRYRAEKYLADKNMLKNLLAHAVNKTEDRKYIGGLWDNVLLSISLVRDWMRGDYRSISRATLLTIVGGILYFVAPIDLIPDFIPRLGFFDDAAVFMLVFKQIASDIQKYKEWKRSETIDADFFTKD